MRIAHVTSAICRRSAGLGAAVASISAATDGAGNEARVFALSSRDWLNGDHLAWTGAPASVFRPWRWSGSLGVAPAMLNALLDFHPDVVHLHGLWTYPSLAVYQWHQKTRRPYLASAHGMLMPVSLRYKSLRKNVAKSLFQDRVLRAASLLHATSTDEEISYRSLGFRNVTEVIPLAIKTVSPSCLPQETTRRRAVFVGRLHHQKGLDLLIKSWLALEGDFPEWDLAIVGPEDSGYAGELKELKRRAAGHRVSFAGPLYGAEKIGFIAASGLFVMPSRSENFGIAAAESLMLGVPVIATTGTPWSGLLTEDSGWWVEPSVPGLETAMRQAMSLDIVSLKRRGKNGQRWVEREYSYAAVRQKWQVAYDGVSASC
jgi:glycosyltransferase involved in cell wall biosynthesis